MIRSVDGEMEGDRGNTDAMSSLYGCAVSELISAFLVVRCNRMASFVLPLRRFTFRCFFFLVLLLIAFSGTVSYLLKVNSPNYRDSP